MERRIFLFGMLSGFVLLFVFGGVFAEAVPAEIVPEAYRELLEGYRELIRNPDPDYDAGDGEIGVIEASLALDPEAALQYFGYAVTDLSGDGTPELFIGAVAAESDAEFYKHPIFAAYTLSDGEAELIFGGWARSAYFWTGGNGFLYTGSGGAMNSIFGTFRLSRDGRTPEWTDYYFTDARDDNFQELGYYYNAAGVPDQSVSTEAEIDAEEFQRLEDSAAAKIRPMELIPFSEASAGTGFAALPVRGRWAEDALSEYSDYDEFAASDHELRVRVLYETSRTVRDFRILDLTFTDFGADGKPVFTEKDLYRQDQLTPERPLVVELVFYGDFPNNGFSYVGADGEVRKFALNLSGLDGSLIAVEY